MCLFLWILDIVGVFADGCAGSSRTRWRIPAGWSLRSGWARAAKLLQTEEDQEAAFGLTIKHIHMYLYTSTYLACAEILILVVITSMCS